MNRITNTKSYFQIFPLQIKLTINYMTISWSPLKILYMKFKLKKKFCLNQSTSLLIQTKEKIHSYINDYSLNSEEDSIP